MKKTLIYCFSLLLIWGINSCKKDNPNPITVGKEYQGGVIFYVDETGKHGLIAAKADQGTATWGCSGVIIDGANGTKIGTGAQNTIDIIAGCNTAGIAAKICDVLVLGGYDDWYLPSIDELKILIDNKEKVGGFGENIAYFSSTEEPNTPNYAKFVKGPINGFYVVDYIQKSNIYSVRAIRSF